METSERRAKKLEQVKALIAKADSTNFDAEREALLAKADSMMAEYAIEAFELEFAKDRKDREPPVQVVFDYGSTGQSDSDDLLWQMFSELARMVGVLVAYTGWRSAKCVGYQMDLDYLDLLMTGIRLNLAVTMEPKPSSVLTLEENLAALKEAGLKWQRVYELLVPVYPEDPHFRKGRCTQESNWHDHERHDIVVPNPLPTAEPWYFHKTMPRNIGVWFTGVYTRHCKENDRSRMYSNPTVWRRNFQEGYVYRVRERIREMTRAREDAARGHELVLVSMKNDLKDFFFEAFPELRPHPKNCDCDIHHRCNDPKCQRPACKAARMPTKRRYRSEPERKFDYAAQKAGQAAGDRADLTGGRNNVTQGDRKELG